MISVSERASQKLKDIFIEQCLNTGLGFRVIRNDVVSGNRSLSIKLDSQCAGDEVIDLRGVKLLMGPGIKEFLGDCELDYSDELEGGFLVKADQRPGGLNGIAGKDVGRVSASSRKAYYYGGKGGPGDTTNNEGD